MVHAEKMKKAYFLSFAAICGTVLGTEFKTSNIQIGDTIINRYHADVINSTQIYCRNNKLVDIDQPNVWTLVTTDSQTNGIGSHGRKWVSHMNGNVYATLCVPSTSIDSAILVSHAATFAILKTVKEVLPESVVQYKWPNDIIVNEKKISGRLCEFDAEKHQIILGIGINVNMEPSDLKKINQPATSLFAEMGIHYAVDEILLKILENLIDSLKDFEVNKEATLKDLNEYLAFRGELVCVHDDNENCDYDNCELVEVDENGFLILKDGDVLCKPIRNGTLTRNYSE